MIYLYTLPGVAFNAPQFSIPLIKGYLKTNKIESKQIDLSIKFFEKCVNSNYIKSKFNDYYFNLSNSDKKVVDDIDKYIDYLKCSQINTNKIIKSNEKLLNYLNIYSNYYNINWNRKGIEFNIKLSTIDEVLNFALDKENKIFDIVLKTNYKLLDNDVHYLSIQFPFQLPYAIRFAKKIKRNSPNCKVIFGGDYITHIIKNIVELMKKCSDIDAIVLFGNHETLVKVIESFNRKTAYDIPNAYIRDGNKIIKNLSEKCNKLKINYYVPSFEDLDLDKYVSNLRLIQLTLNYGCYHSKCNFCSRHFYYNGYCGYNLDKIFALIKKLYIENKIQAIYFIDECVPPSILIKLANYIISNKINVKWMVETRIDRQLLDINVAKLLYNSGCREISFGIESYNKKILKDMNKQIDLKVAKKVMKNFFESGVSVSATFMIGYPTENIFNILRTLNFIKKFKYIDTFGLGVFNYMRNSILVDNANLDESSDLNLIYRKNNDNYVALNKLIARFNATAKIKNFSNIRNKILYRSEYMYLDRKKYSLNFARQVKSNGNKKFI